MIKQLIYKRSVLNSNIQSNILVHITFKSLSVNAIENVDNVGVYVAEYSTKEIEDMKMQLASGYSPGFENALKAMGKVDEINKFSKLSAKKLYFSSRSLIQPEVEYTNDYNKINALLI
ncbi:hypothetical protein K4Q31_11975 [Staphylococcus epidermidis]|nr:hypothetical protein [Staphylococcus epidermidis]MCG1164986.1 hypothetical protein [Staphylococcus epidermidis]MCG2085461.1 hypothetical protein [Staphylococcus epidermidis]MCG2223266.1 hypothetical protein [Staphylococcus epidermidis]MCG2254716.1 hypothetical protein [Staphylococcus epidermidis]